MKSLTQKPPDLHIESGNKSGGQVKVSTESTADPAVRSESLPEVAINELSGRAFTKTPAKATQVADHFHLIKLANLKLDECRRRVQNEREGLRGRKDDPFYCAKRLLTMADERLDDRGRGKLMGLLNAGDPKGEVFATWQGTTGIVSSYSS